jgi:hypothetical protein
VAELDHDYLESRNLATTYVIGSNSAIDKMVKLNLSSNQPTAQRPNTVLSDSILEWLCPANIDGIVSMLYDSEQFRAKFVSKLRDTSQLQMKQLRHRKIGFVSCLRQNALTDMKEFSWGPVVEEFMERAPVLFQLVFSCMVKEEHMLDPLYLGMIIPKLALIYSIVAFSFHNELSLVQRIMATLLHERNADRVVGF